MPYSIDGQVTSEKSPAYFVTEAAIARIHAMNSSIKLIVIVRDPVTRLISDYAQLAANKRDRQQSSSNASGGIGGVTGLSGRRAMGGIGGGRRWSMPTFERLVLLPSGEVNIDYKPVKTSIYALYYSRWLQVRIKT